MPSRLSLNLTWAGPGRGEPRWVPSWSSFLFFFVFLVDIGHCLSLLWFSVLGQHWTNKRKNQQWKQFFLKRSHKSRESDTSRAKPNRTEPSRDWVKAEPSRATPSRSEPRLAKHSQADAQRQAEPRGSGRGRTQPGNRFVPFVRACAWSGCHGTNLLPFPFCRARFSLSPLCE